MAARRESEGTADDGPRGLYDGFEGYRTPDAESYRQVLTSGIVAIDANVLLNLYRYADQARDDLLDVLKHLRDRLWVPHQALTEFWRNRGTVLRDPRDTDRTVKELRSAQGKAETACRTWAKRVSLPDDLSRQLTDALTDAFDRAVEGVAAFSDASAARAAGDTGADVVLERLEDILAGRVGPPLSTAAHAEAIAEGRRRAQVNEPPGYEDGAKEGDDVAGDYLVWRQTLVEAERRGGDVLLVTADVKEDWWRKERSELRGPRVELADELRAHSGGRLFMLTPSELLKTARAVLNVAVHDASVEAAERVDQWSERASDGGGGGDQIARYWREYLSRNARRVFHAAANIEIYRGPDYTLDDIAEHMSITYESARSLHRTSGRAARRWREDTGTEPPIRLDWTDYRQDDSQNGMRTTYRLPSGIADEIQLLATG
jgi:PIN like domain